MLNKDAYVIYLWEICWVWSNGIWTFLKHSKLMQSYLGIGFYHLEVNESEVKLSNWAVQWIIISWLIAIRKMRIIFSGETFPLCSTINRIYIYIYIYIHTHTHTHICIYMTPLEAAEMRFLRSITGYTRLDKIRSEVIRKELEISGKQEVRLKYKQNWINHLERMNNTRLPKHALNYKPRGRRDRGRPRKRWQCVDAGTGQTT